MIVLIDGIRYQLTTPKSEAVLENAIQANCQHIFGPDSFYFDIKRRIKSKAGVVSIPDGYVIFFTSPNKPRLAIIEVELACHSIYRHVVPQLSKFNRGIEDSSAKRKLIDVLYDFFEDDEVLRARLKQKIKSGEIHKFISDLVSEKPLIVVAIDEKTEELDEALYDIRGDVKVVEFKTFRREGLSGDVNAYLFEPVEANPIIDLERTITDPGPPPPTITAALIELFDKNGVDNVTYDECLRVAREVKPKTKFDRSHFSWHKNKYKKEHKGGLPRDVRPLPRGLKLRSVYKGKIFTAKVVEDGKIRFRNQTYDSPSGAAKAALESTGSKRSGANGWTWWKCVDPETGEEKPLGDCRTDPQLGSTDKWGYRLGSKQAKINAVLSTEPKAMKTLLKEAGLSNTQYGHLRSLIEKGFVEKTGNGFREIVGPKTEIDVSPPDGYSEFWEPIRKEGLFKGKPVPIKDEGWIGKGIKGLYILLEIHNHACQVKLWFRGEDRLDRRKKLIALFPKTNYEYRLHESPKAAQAIFPVLDKGKKDREHWPEIRKKLTTLAADIYTKIKESDT